MYLSRMTIFFFFCRNVVGMKNANSTEMDGNAETAVVIDMPEHNPGKMGGTMRLGRRATIFRSEGKSVLSKYQRYFTV